MIEADQIFVKAQSRDNTVEALKRVAALQGFEFSDVSLPLPDRYTTPDRKATRSFYIAKPINDWVCILEAKGGDEEMARSLSKVMSARVIWFTYSERVEEAKAAIYESGVSVHQTSFHSAPKAARKIFSFSIFDRRSDAEEQLQTQCEAFYKEHDLPWPFYSYEQIDGSPNRAEYFERLSFLNERAKKG